jgi:nucleolar protein 14
LLLALFADIFPTTDKTHPVTTPAALFLGNVLAHCAVRSRREAVAAVVASALAAAYSAPAGRVFPEAISLLTGLIHAAAGDEEVAWSEGLAARVAEQVGGPWLGLDSKDDAADDDSDFSTVERRGLSLPSMIATFGASSAFSQKDPDWLPGGGSARTAALAAAASTLNVLLSPARATPSAREWLAPARDAAERVLRRIERLEDAKSAKTKKRKSVKSAKHDEYASAKSACAALVAEADAALAGARRAPLRWRTKAAEAIKQFNPVYEEEGYQRGRDYDPNRERAEARRLQRQLKQEARGAVRELRKDNKFLAERRGAEAAAAKEERGEKQRETMAFLEKMEGDLKSGGQGGVIVKTQRRVNGGRGRDRKKR